MEPQSPERNCVVGERTCLRQFTCKKNELSVRLRCMQQVEIELSGSASMNMQVELSKLSKTHTRRRRLNAAQTE